MKSIDRRTLLRNASLAAMAVPFRGAAQTSMAATITLHPELIGARVPANFIGLSYEVEQLSDPTFFSAENSGLITQFRALAPHGVLRLGGNTSDVGWWKPNAAATQPPMNVRKVVGEPSADLSYSISPEAITNLRGFLDATEWTCIFGINLATNTPSRAADEAVFVAKTLGAKLEYFQIGNEPDLFKSHMRDPATWNADHYFDEWYAMANAILARVPDAKFGLPDTAGEPEWYARVVQRMLALSPNSIPPVAALTHHYYLGGPPSNPDVNIQRLLQANLRVDQLAHDIRAAAAQLHVPYRMTEGNTCYRGGKPGVSDTLAAALWAADYALKLASLGYAGINLHGGGGKQVANSLGGTLPGEDLMPDRTVPHPRPFYTPIANINGKYTAEPVYYGLQFAQNFAGSTFFRLGFNPGLVNATAYAARLTTGQQIVAIINKDESKTLTFDLPTYALTTVMHGPSLSSTHVQLSEPSTFREASEVPPFTAMLFRSVRDSHE